MSRAAVIATERPHAVAATWTATQAYVLATFCLAFGLVLGYLFRGSASPVSTEASTAAETSSPAGVPAGMPGAKGANLTPQQKEAMLAQAADPMLKELKQNPNNFETIVKLGNLYYDGQQYQNAIEYYQKAVKMQPANSDVRTDLGTAYWYLGDADKALAEFNRALKYKPTHPGTLFNMGVVKWQGKMDPAGAVQAWEKLLKTNPEYPNRQQVQDLIARAKQHADRG